MFIIKKNSLTVIDDAVTNFKFVPLNAIDVGSNLFGEIFLLFFSLSFFLNRLTNLLYCYIMKIYYLFAIF